MRTNKKYLIEGLKVPKDSGIIDLEDTFTRYVAERYLKEWDTDRVQIHYQNVKSALDHLKYILTRISGGEIKSEDVETLPNTSIALSWKRPTQEELSEIYQGLGENQLGKISGTCLKRDYEYRIRNEPFPHWGINGDFIQKDMKGRDYVGQLHVDKIYKVVKDPSRRDLSTLESVAKAVTSRQVVSLEDIKLKNVSQVYLRNVNFQDAGEFYFREGNFSLETGLGLSLVVPILDKDKNVYFAQNATIARELIRSSYFPEDLVEDVKKELLKEPLGRGVKQSNKGLSLKMC